MRELLQRLEEASGARVVLDMGHYEEDVRDVVQDLYDYSVRKYKEQQAGALPKRAEIPGLTRTVFTYEMPTFEVESEVQGIVAATRINMQKLVARVDAALGRMPGWESGAAVVVMPNPSRDEGRHEQISLDPAKHANVLIGTTGNSRPGFTLFGDGTVDDVLDAGDRDFFRDPAIEGDYFGLVSEMEHPGSTKRAEGKVVVVYTARPTADRMRFERATTIPHGVFLTNDIDTVEGYAHDLAGSGGRDIYKIRIDDRYLRVTLSSGRVREYQVIGREGVVPVKDIEWVDTVK